MRQSHSIGSVPLKAPRARPPRLPPLDDLPAPEVVARREHSDPGVDSDDASGRSRVRLAVLYLDGDDEFPPVVDAIVCDSAISLDALRESRPPGECRAVGFGPEDGLEARDSGRLAVGLDVDLVLLDVEALPSLFSGARLELELRAGVALLRLPGVALVDDASRDVLAQSVREVGELGGRVRAPRIFVRLRLLLDLLPVWGSLPGFDVPCARVKPCRADEFGLLDAEPLGRSERVECGDGAVVAVPRAAHELARESPLLRARLHEEHLALGGALRFWGRTVAPQDFGLALCPQLRVLLDAARFLGHDRFLCLAHDRVLEARACEPCGLVLVPFVSIRCRGGERERPRLEPRRGGLSRARIGELSGWHPEARRHAAAERCPERRIIWNGSCIGLLLLAARRRCPRPLRRGLAALRLLPLGVEPLAPLPAPAAGGSVLALPLVAGDAPLERPRVADGCRRRGERRHHPGARRRGPLGARPLRGTCMAPILRNFHFPYALSERLFCPRWLKRGRKNCKIMKYSPETVVVRCHRYRRIL